jgi:hypothetical protein
MMNLILRNLLPLTDKPPSKVYVVSGDANRHYILFAIKLLLGEDIPVFTGMPDRESANMVTVFDDSGETQRGRVLYARGIPSRSSVELRQTLQARALRIKRIALVITTRCTLRCPHCVHLNSSYTERKDFSVEQVLASMGRVFHVAESVDAVSVMGGEALVHPDLCPILEALCDEKRLGEVSLTTNGTLLPAGPVLAALKHPRVRVFISNYPALVAPNTAKLIEILEEQGIRYDVAPAEKPWVDAGGTEIRKRNEGELAEMYARCLFAACPTLLGGKLYNCPRNANAAYQGLIPMELSGGISLDGADDQALKEQIIETLYVHEQISCCDRCDFILPRGTQKLIPKAS